MANLVSREQVEALIQEQVVSTIQQDAPKQSVFMGLASKLPNMTSKQTRVPVLDLLPVAYWVNGDTGFKQTSQQAWDNVYLTAAELAVIVPIPEAVLDDSSYDLIGEITPRVNEAIGMRVDGTVIFDTGRPAEWESSIITRARRAGNNVAVGSSPNYYDLIMGEGGVFAKVEEYGCAKGGIVFKPYVSGENICFDAVQADRFFPTAFDSSGNITGAVFVERIIKGGRYYTRLEEHSQDKTTIKITNKAFMSRDESILGEPIPLENVERWADIAPESVISNIDKPLFAYFKVAQANTIDASSPLGVSVYARAVDLIKEADKQYSRLLWENEGGELAIDADVSILKDDRGNLQLPQGKERLFRHYKNFSDVEGGSPIQIFSPTLRDTSLINSLNQLLMRIEDTVGLARGTFSDAQNQAKTATELKMMKQRTYCLVSDNQKALEKALTDCIEAANTLADIYKLAPKGEYEISFNWDDSIITDKDEERDKLLQEVAAGIISPVVYLSETRGIPEDEAKKLMPDMEQLIDDEPKVQPNNSMSGIETEKAVEEAESAAGKTLNGAQTQSLISVIQQYSSGVLTLGQAVNIIAASLGITKEEAKAIIEGAE